ncbi:hypothetical protein JCM15831A_01850 [Asaia astilbis]
MDARSRNDIETGLRFPQHRKSLCLGKSRVSLIIEPEDGLSVAVIADPTFETAIAAGFVAP